LQKTAGINPAVRFISILKIFSHAANTMNAKSRVTTRQAPHICRRATGYDRLSIGIEKSDNILFDLDQALQASQQ
jgi:O-acetylhomoserine (thiol)-lyase